MSDLEFVVAVNDDAVFANNFARSKILEDASVRVQVKRGYPSAAVAYNEALDAAKSDVVAFVHQDVYLPSRWQTQIASALGQLAEADPRWAVAGLFGTTADGRNVGQVWSSGLNRMLGEAFGEAIAVDSVDELLILVRRSSNIRFDEGLPGFHLYGTDISQTALANRWGVYVVCAPVIHNSRPVLYLPRDYLRAYDYVRAKWQSRLPIQNCVSPIAKSPLRDLRRWGSCRLGELRYRGVDRSAFDRKLDCVAIAGSLGLE